MITDEDFNRNIHTSNFDSSRDLTRLEQLISPWMQSYCSRFEGNDLLEAVSKQLKSIHAQMRYILQASADYLRYE